MKPKIKAFLVNFLGFVALFLILRYTLLYFFPEQHYVSLFIAAITASVLSPKCGVVVENGQQRVKVKWFLLKGVRDIT